MYKSKLTLELLSYHLLSDKLQLINGLQNGFPDTMILKIFRRSYFYTIFNYLDHIWFDAFS